MIAQASRFFKSQKYAKNQVFQFVKTTSVARHKINIEQKLKLALRLLYDHIHRIAFS